MLQVRKWLANKRMRSGNTKKSCEIAAAHRRQCLSQSNLWELKEAYESLAPDLYLQSMKRQIVEVTEGTLGLKKLKATVVVPKGEDVYTFILPNGKIEHPPKPKCHKEKNVTGFKMTSIDHGISGGENTLSEAKAPNEQQAGERISSTRKECTDLNMEIYSVSSSTDIAEANFGPDKMPGNSKNSAKGEEYEISSTESDAVHSSTGTDLVVAEMEAL